MSEKKVPDHWNSTLEPFCLYFLLTVLAFFFLQLYKDEKYKYEAFSCGEVIWSRGLLKKGYGICHGVAGNAYAFLALYRLTGDKKFLHRALKVQWYFLIWLY